MTHMKTFYVQLYNPLRGYYVKFKAADIDEVSKFASDFFGRSYLGVASEPYFYEVERKRHKCKVINPNEPVVIRGGEYASIETTAK